MEGGRRPRMPICGLPMANWWICGKGWTSYSASLFMGPVITWCEPIFLCWLGWDVKMLFDLLECGVLISVNTSYFLMMLSMKMLKNDLAQLYIFEKSLQLGGWRWLVPCPPWLNYPLMKGSLPPGLLFLLGVRQPRPRLSEHFSQPSSFRQSPDSDS